MGLHPEVDLIVQEQLKNIDSFSNNWSYRLPDLIHLWFSTFQTYTPSQELFLPLPHYKMAEAQLNDFQSLFSVKGKIAVVTGGSRGLGLTAASA